MVPESPIKTRITTKKWRQRACLFESIRHLTLAFRLDLYMRVELPPCHGTEHYGDNHRATSSSPLIFLLCASHISCSTHTPTALLSYTPQPPPPAETLPHRLGSGAVGGGYKPNTTNLCFCMTSSVITWWFPAARMSCRQQRLRKHWKIRKIKILAQGRPFGQAILCARLAYLPHGCAHFWVSSMHISFTGVGW